MSFIPRMHTDGSRTADKIGIASSVGARTRGTMIVMTPTMTSLSDIILRLEAGMWGESNHSLAI
jgi:hypothetical protein